MRSSARDRFLASLAVFCGFLAVAQAPSSKPVSIVGRNGKFEIIEPDGSASKIRTDNLKLLEVKRAAPAAPEPDTEASATNRSPEKPAADDASPEAGGQNDSTGSTPGAAPESSSDSAGSGQTPKEETPEEKAIRAKDVSDLRMWRQLGGAYFYDKDNKPISFDEVDRRIATGEVEGMRVIGLQLQDWTPQTKSDDQVAAGEAERPKSAAPERKIHPPLVYDAPYARLPEKKK